MPVRLFAAQGDQPDCHRDSKGTPSSRLPSSCFREFVQGFLGSRAPAQPPSRGTTAPSAAPRALLPVCGAPDPLEQPARARRSAHRVSRWLQVLHRPALCHTPGLQRSSHSLPQAGRRRRSAVGRFQFSAGGPRPATSRRRRQPGAVGARGALAQPAGRPVAQDLQLLCRAGYEALLRAHFRDQLSGSARLPVTTHVLSRRALPLPPLAGSRPCCPPWLGQPPAHRCLGAPHAAAGAAAGHLPRLQGRHAEPGGHVPVAHRCAGTGLPRPARAAGGTLATGFVVGAAAGSCVQLDPTAGGPGKGSCSSVTVASPAVHCCCPSGRPAPAHATRLRRCELMLSPAGSTSSPTLRPLHRWQACCASSGATCRWPRLWPSAGGWLGTWTSCTAC